MSKDLKLIIEVDGYSHFIDEVIIKDEKKQKALEDLGYTVIRFRDSEILNQIDRVQIAILNSIQQIKDDRILPLPPPEGETQS